MAKKMEVYLIYNLPLPNINRYSIKLSNLSKKIKRMTAQYMLEANAIAINKARTKFTLLNELEARDCSKPLSTYCEFQSPILPTNINRYCVVALLTGTKRHIKNACKIVVKPNEMLPLAKHIQNGLWMISTNQVFIFNIYCKDKENAQTRRIRVIPPMGVISLKPGCQADSKFLTLPPIYDFSSTVKLKGQITQLERMSKENFSLWQPLTKSKLGVNFSWSIENLSKIQEIKMEDLLAELNNVEAISVNDDNKWEWWQYLLIGIALFLIISIIYTIKINNCLGRKYKRKVSIKLRKVNVDDSNVAIESDKDETIENSSEIIQNLIPPTPQEIESNNDDDNGEPAPNQMKYDDDNQTDIELSEKN